MDIRVDGDTVSMTMTKDEAARTGFALRAGYETMSRPEYYILTGLSQPVIREIARVLMDAQDATIDLAPGIEALENPRRPRPLA